MKLLTTLGFLYSLSFLIIFVRYRNTPVVKSSNIPLTFTQIVLHFGQSCQLRLTLMKQSRTVCLLHSVTSGNALKLIIAIWMIKTNQILSIFWATSKVKRKHFIKLGDIAVPSIFITCNVLMSVTILTQSSFQFGIYEIRSAVVRLHYCKMSIYFYIDSTAVIFLSIICSIKAFQGRHLPSNYNEMKYIFLSMFTLSIQLALSLILHTNFQREGIVILIDSILLQFAGLSVLSITYGYRIYINTTQLQFFGLNCLKGFMMTFLRSDTAQKMKFSFKVFFSKCDQIRSFLRIWSHFTEETLYRKLYISCSVITQRLIENPLKH